MSLTCTYAELATVDELFTYKSEGFELPHFAGYTTDQWGIKAHNRPWIAANGRWEAGQRVIEPGGGYSRLAEWLGTTYGLEPWVADDFGVPAGEALWSRWGDPAELPKMHPTVHYQFENFGPGSSYPSAHFDRIFTVSTLEHIPPPDRLGVLRDLHRCLAPGGIELHTIDIRNPGTRRVMVAAGAELLRLGRFLDRHYTNGIGAWIRLFRASGVEFATSVPSTLSLLDRRILVESPDVVFRYFPPKDAPKPYKPAASLLLIIEDRPDGK
jgi:SAM-dependent methyltransferase